jgi:hypothetical protein
MAQQSRPYWSLAHSVCRSLSVVLSPIACPLARCVNECGILLLQAHVLRSGLSGHCDCTHIRDARA